MQTMDFSGIIKFRWILVEVPWRGSVKQELCSDVNNATRYKAKTLVGKAKTLVGKAKA